MAVTWQSIATELGRSPSDVSDVQRSQWAQWVTDGYDQVATRARRLGVPFEALDAATVDRVVRLAVAGHVRRPDNATEVTVSVDDGQTSRRYASGAGQVTVSDQGWADLGLTERVGGAFSVDPAYEAGWRS